MTRQSDLATAVVNARGGVDSGLVEAIECLDMRCPHCSAENPGTAKFCSNCGKPLARECPRCGTANLPTATFCTNCGARLETSASRTASPTKLSASAGMTSTSPRDLSLTDASPDALIENTSGIEGERKPVTILFTDIVGSTALAEKLDPEEWKEIVSGAHQRVSAAVYRYGGIIAQLLGDGVLAFFGAPTTHEDDPVRAVHTGYEIQQAISEYARSLAGYVDNFQMRIGIHSGTVVLGNVGSDRHVEYLAIGDAVNLAARLQSAAQPGKVLVSDTTARFVQATFDLAALGAISVKGKAEPVNVFEVVAPRAVPESGRGVQGLGSTLVGRARELDTLRALLSDLAQGHGHIVSIIGEPGIGKSRLAEEARLGDGNRKLDVGDWRLHDKQVASNDHRPTSQVHWLEGRSLSYGQTLSFWTITQLIKADLGLGEADPDPKVRASLRKRLQALAPERAVDLMPYLSHLLGIKVEGPAAERIQMLDGETLKRQTLLATRDYFASVAKVAPTVLEFEDLHWADPSTIQALEQLLDVTDRAPLLILLLFRPERDLPSWGIKLRAETDLPHRYTEIVLKHLSPEDSNQLMSQLLDVADLPEKARRQILSRSEGNPFYLEEILRHLIDRGAIVREGELWRATRDVDSIEIPETLQGVLLARIDRLEEDVRRTLQLASVIGRSFLYRLLEAIARAEQQLDRHLTLLQRADLVREKTRRPELEYIFKHSLTQEAAYNSLLVERRREFHRRVAEALEDLFGDRKEEYFGLLAYHFDRAGEREKAVQYLLAAGDRTRLEDAHTEAIQHYRRAVELLTEMGDHERAAKTWLKLGLVYHANFEFEAAHQANEAAFALRRAAQARGERGESEAVQPPGAPVVCRIGPPAEFAEVVSIDPAKVFSIGDIGFCGALFAGIAEIDHELNVVPHAAISWEVLDKGTRYIIHLRDDVHWTDGTQVTAADFEWACKRNLAPATRATLASVLDDVVGAEEYRKGRNADPQSVAVRELDRLTLEFQLKAPTAYFPYILTEPVTFPLHRATVERYGTEWWKPEHIVSNGPFCLREFTHRRIVLERNHDYFGDFAGNVDRLEVGFYARAERLERYVRNDLELAGFHGSTDDVDTAGIPASERWAFFSLGVDVIQFMPNRRPLEDIRVRRALTLALDKAELAKQMRVPASLVAYGGIIPPGMPGHSPDIALPFDLEQARQLLAEAGYPGGAGFPVLKMSCITSAGPEVAQMWHDHLGITVEATKVEGQGSEEQLYDLHFDGWMADYPDPDSYTRNSETFQRLKRWTAWPAETYEALVDAAAHTTDREKRLAMYREADRIWVSEQVLAAPIIYGFEAVRVHKPWAENAEPMPLGYHIFRNLRVNTALRDTS